MKRRLTKPPKYVHEVPKDMVLVPRREVLKPLTEMQEKFCQAYARGASSITAARIAGWKHKSAGDLALAKPPVVQRIHELRKQYEEEGRMTKKKVMDGFLEAIDIGRLKGESMSMISGWREIARMCGYFEPTKHRIEVDIQGKVIVQRLQGLSDAELLRLAEGGEDVIDADFIEMDNGQPTIADPVLLARSKEENSGPP